MPSPPKKPLCRAGGAALLRSWGKYQRAGAGGVTGGPKLQTHPLHSFTLLFFRGKAGFDSAAPAVTWGELRVVGPPALAPAKVHQAQMSGENDERWGGIPLLHGCDTTKF